MLVAKPWQPQVKNRCVCGGIDLHKAVCRPFNRNPSLRHLKSRIVLQPCRSYSDVTRPFLEWIDRNSQPLLAGNAAKLALYEDDQGDRGVLCCEAMSKGEPVLHVPLRLAIKDYQASGEREAQAHEPYEGAPWSVRLAAKLLRMKAEGEANPWFPYLQILPTHVPSPLTGFSWEDMQEVEYDVMKEQLYSADFLATDAFRHCEPASIAGSSDEQFRWALAVVHSRTFGVAAEGGGVGVRMLVPLMDMLNHAGDQTPGLLTQPHSEFDNVRWDVVGPERSKSGDWEMVLKASRDIQVNEQVLLSYGERSNDDFFLHYGFVPLCNPHDDVVLFPNLEDALNWHHEKFPMEGPEPGIYQLYEAAYQAGLREVMKAQAGKPASAPTLALQQETGEPNTQLKMVAGNRVDTALIAAFASVAKGNLQHAEAAVATRCWEMLGRWQPLVCDLALLAHHLQDKDAGKLYQYLVQHYYLVTRYTGLNPFHGTVNSGQQPSTGSPYATNSSSTSDASSTGSSSSTEQPVSELPDGRDVPTLIKFLLQAASSGQDTVSCSRRLAVEYRVYKKMILWDLVLEKNELKYW